MAEKDKVSVKNKIPAIYLLSRLWIPVSVFFFFLASIFSRDELMVHFLGNASQVIHQIINYGSQIGLWMSSAFLVQRMTTVFVWDGLIAGISGRSVPRLPKDVTGLCIFGVAVIGIVATVFDKSVTGIWATSGVVSIVIGIALRNVILDVFIGLSMHVEKPFRIGDWVMVHQNRRENHIVGQVIEVNWRTTRLKTTQKNMVVIPNSRMGEAILTNYMEPKPHFRIELSFILDYSVSPNRAIRILSSGVKSLADDKHILSDPAPEIRLDQAVPNGQKYEIRFFILPINISPKESKHIVNKSILEHLAQAGLSPSMEKETVFINKSAKLPLVPSVLSENFDEVINSSKLMDVLKENELKGLFQDSKMSEVKAGEILYRQGNLGDAFYFLAEGLLCSSIDLPREPMSIKIEHFGPGSHFGVEGVLSEKIRLSTVMAITDCIIFLIDKKIVIELTKKNPKFHDFLKEKMMLGQEKIIKTKWGQKQKEHSFSKGKKRSKMGSAIQTLFTEFLPSASPTSNVENSK